MNDALNRRAIVTGASRGIGHGIARRLVEDGWTVLNLDIRAPHERSPDVEWIEVDLADPAALEAALASALAGGPVTGLVNNAGIVTPSALGDVTTDEFDATMAVNLRAPVLCAKAVAPGMRELGFGRIVNVASRAHLGKTLRTTYAASKGGIVSAAKVWALELAPYAITCNVVAPGPIRTELFEAANPPDLPRTQEIIGTVPLGRLGEPADIAHAVSFFMDPRSDFITGQVLYVCGGVTLARAGS